MVPHILSHCIIRPFSIFVAVVRPPFAIVRPPFGRVVVVSLCLSARARDRAAPSLFVLVLRQKGPDRRRARARSRSARPARFLASPHTRWPTWT